MQLGIMTINVNSWSTFKMRWAEEGLPGEFTAKHVIMLQEHHLTSEDTVTDTQQWLAARGWRSVFSRAALLASGRPSGGVALLIRDAPNLGVIDVGLDAGQHAHRLIGVRVDLEGLAPCIAISAYLQDSVGMNELNRQILARIAIWQEQSQLPAMVGGDFNLAPDTVANSTFGERSGLGVIATSAATKRTRRSSTVIDYFLLATAIAERVTQVQVHHGFPLRPHSPVSCTIETRRGGRTQVLDMPPRLPLHVPYGPEQERRDWAHLDRTIGDAIQQVRVAGTSRRQRLDVLDTVYDYYVKELEHQLCLLTDTPRRRRSRRGRFPSIQWVDQSDRSKEHLCSWRSLLRPLHWIQGWAQDVLRYLDGRTSDVTAHTLYSDLVEHPPAEYQQIPSLILIFQRAQLLGRALTEDESAGTINAVLNTQVFETFLGEVDKAVGEE